MQSGIHNIPKRKLGKSHARVIPAPFNFGNAISFDGTNDFAEAPGLDGRAFPTAGTVECWVYKNDLVATKIFFSTKKTATAQKLVSVNTTVTTGVIVFFFRNEDNSITSSLSSSTGIVAATWNHIVITWDTSLPRRRIYLNGVLDIETTAAFATACPTNYLHFTFGQNVATSFWNGKIDEPRYYEREITIAEVVASYNQGFGGSPFNTDGLIAAWDCNELSGTNADDWVGTNDLTLTNGAAFAAH